jgi:hypothetical protein
VSAEIDQSRAALLELQSLLHMDAIAPDDELNLRTADIEIELAGLEATSQRTPPDSVRWNAIVLGCSHIDRRIAELVMEILAYYSLPAEAEGSNEPVVGPSHARTLRSRYLKRLAGDEARLMQLRDELAAFLLKLNSHDDEEEQ